MYQSKMRMQQENVDKGQLQITVVNSDHNCAEIFLSA